ncbi:MAG: hypothetical protein PVI97_17580 [Candidatus Thiodiazotropha sp.]|jgi:hypothetical protein
MMKFLKTILLVFFAHNAYAGEWSDWFTISRIFVSSASNMHFRVGGMESIDDCTNGKTWAYVNESDSGASAKISTLLSAHAAGKNVRLYVSPTDVYGNGKVYCHVVELQVK